MDTDNSLFGCFVSGPSQTWEDSTDTRLLLEERGRLFRSYVWGESGLCPRLKSLRADAYGEDVRLILLAFSIDPLAEEWAARQRARPYRKKERSIEVVSRVDGRAFELLADEERRLFVKQHIVGSVQRIREVAKRLSLDTDVERLESDLLRLLD